MVFNDEGGVSDYRRPEGRVVGNPKVVYPRFGGSAHRAADAAIKPSRRGGDTARFNCPRHFTASASTAAADYRGWVGGNRRRIGGGAAPAAGVSSLHQPSGTMELPKGVN